MNLSKRLLGFTAYVTLGLLAGSLSQPALARSPVPVTTDLWDVSQGVEITAHSGVIEAYPIRNMFGATEGIGETGHMLFRDDQLSGFVHFVEWRTPQPVRLESFSLFAIHDGVPFDANERGFRRFTLLARNPATTDFDPLFDFFPTNPYQTGGGPHFHLVSASVTPTIAQEFRAEFEQFGDRTPPARGPRIVELDGFGVVVPEPAAWGLLTLGLACLTPWARRLHNRARSTAAQPGRT